MNTDSNIALVTDYLIKRRGAENVFEQLTKIVPNSAIFALLHDRKEFEFDGREVETSFVSRIPRALKNYRKHYLLYPAAIKTFDFSRYQLIISNSSHWAHGIISHPEAIHLCYCHTPNRYLWNYYHDYLKTIPYSKAHKKLFFALYASMARRWDWTAAQRVDRYIASSKVSQKRIMNYYGRESTIIYPPIDMSAWELSADHANYFLVVSEFLPYKKIDVIVKAFKFISENLIIVGTGPEERMLKRISQDSSNINIISNVTQLDLVELYRNAKGIIVAAEEDFGLVALEAQACGKPVIAFRGGGSIETIQEEISGLFFNEQSPTSLLDTLSQYRFNEFDPVKVRKSIERFDIVLFRDQWNKLINEHL